MRRPCTLIAAMLLAFGTAAAQTKVIAHRGYWNSKKAAQNSVRALRNAYKAGAWGSEFDVHITKDGVVVVCHDDDIHGVIIEDTTYAAIRRMRLANGERLPTLRRYLEAGSKLGGMRLVLEVKEHARPEREDSCVAQCLREVRRLGLQGRVDYISFSLHACDELLRLEPSARVFYLNGDLAPQDVKARGFAGIDYSSGAMTRHPQWVDECHSLGLEVNVWTVDDIRLMRRFKEAGVDYITTNKPVVLRTLCGE